MGYDDTKEKIKLVSDGAMNFKVYEKAIKLGEVVVYAERAESNVSGTQMGIVKLDLKAIKELHFLWVEEISLRVFSYAGGSDNR